MIKQFMFIWIALLCSFSASKAQTTLDYIHENVAYAQELMRENHIPASVILAVAIHESASGTSKIARYLNNHFGVKGQNSSTEIRSSYKGYPTIQDSYDHFVEFLQNRSSFSNLFDRFGQSNYIGWAKGIQRGGYARSRSWASQVIGLIKKYELYKYDETEVVSAARIEKDKKTVPQSRIAEYLKAVFPIPFLTGKINMKNRIPDN